MNKNNDYDFDYDFGAYTCATTHLPCCGCSLFCEHRQFAVWKKFYDGWFEYYYNIATGEKKFKLDEKDLEVLNKINIKGR